MLSFFSETCSPQRLQTMAAIYLSFHFDEYFTNQDKGGLQKCVSN